MQRQMPMCRHYDELKVMQSELSHKLGNFAFRMENIRPILTRANYEMPQRLHQSLNVTRADHIDSMACKKFCRTFSVRDTSHANQILRDFGTLRIGSIDLMFRINPQEMDENPGHQDKLAVNGAPIEAVDWCKLSTELLTPMMECGRSDAFNKTVRKIYCQGKCINFCGFAVVELPLYATGCCLPLIDVARRHEPMSTTSQLQKHQHKVHEELVKRIRSELNAWNISDLKKTIRFDENERTCNPIRSWAVQDVSADDALTFSSK